MTKRDAVYVGCRLIAIYQVFEAANALMTYVIAIGTMATMNTGRGGGFGPAEIIMRQTMYSLIPRVGIALLLWCGAGMLSRIAAEAEEADFR